MAENTTSNIGTLPPAPISTQKDSTITISVNHSILASFSSFSVSEFLELWDRYDSVITEQTRPHFSDDGSISGPRRLVFLNFCVDGELLESTISLGYIAVVKSYDLLDNDML